MTELKCPICNVELAEFEDLYACVNDHCPWVGNKELWQELIRTRKALEIAVDALKDIRCIYTGDQTTKPSTMFGRAAGALNKIQELEQNDR